MIAVVGEALIDLIPDAGGGVVAAGGGGPFNTARTIARLGQEVAFLGRLSGDAFGRVLLASLERDGVRVLEPEPADAPTTLAVADVSPAGGTRYRFYLAGTSAAALGAAAAQALPAGVAAVHVGTLALVMEPAGSTVERLVAGLAPGTLVMLDPNCRPGAITNRGRYLARIGRLLRRADVVKVSTEDLDYLYPGTRPEAAAAALRSRGPAVVLMTDGAGPARAFLASGQVSAPVPVAEVVDTIGAGDAFGGAFLAWWHGHQLGRADLQRAGLVGEALRAAVDVASLTCAQAGAEPPHAAELAGRPGWDWLTAAGSA